jgi:hypothetical protein
LVVVFAAICFTARIGHAEQEVTKILRDIADEEVRLVKHVCQLDTEKGKVLDSLATEVIEAVTKKVKLGNREVPQLSGFRYMKGTPAVFNLGDEFLLPFDKSLSKLLAPEQIAEYVQERQYRDEARTRVVIDSILELLVRKVDLLPDQRVRLSGRLELWVKPHLRTMSRRLDQEDGLLLSECTPHLNAILNQTQMRIWSMLPKQTLTAAVQSE